MMKNNLVFITLLGLLRINGKEEKMFFFFFFFSVTQGWICCYILQRVNFYQNCDMPVQEILFWKRPV